MPLQSIGLFEAKTHLSEVVARVEGGEEVVITRHNRPVARIVPYEAAPAVDPEKRRQAMAQLQALGTQIARRSGPISQAEISAWIAEGRR